MRITVKQLKQLIREAVEEAMEEELKGDQEKLDKNHDGELSGEDFKILGRISHARAKKEKD